MKNIMNDSVDDVLFLLKTFFSSVVLRYEQQKKEIRSISLIYFQRKMKLREGQQQKLFICLLVFRLYVDVDHHHKHQ